MSGDLPPEPLGEVLERNCGDWSPHKCADFAREYAAREVERERARRAPDVLALASDVLAIMVGFTNEQTQSITRMAIENNRAAILGRIAATIQARIIDASEGGDDGK